MQLIRDRIMKLIYLVNNKIKQLDHVTWLRCIIFLHWLVAIRLGNQYKYISMRIVNWDPRSCTHDVVLYLCPIKCQFDLLGLLKIYYGSKVGIFCYCFMLGYKTLWLEIIIFFNINF